MRIISARVQQMLATVALCACVFSPAHAVDAPPSPDAMLRATVSVGVAASETPVWKRVSLGTYKNVNLLREDLDSVDCGAAAVPQVASAADVAFARRKPTGATCNLGEAAAEIIGRPAFTLSKTRSDLDLVVLSPADLGLAGSNLKVAAVYARAALLGFALCPAEVGPQLRLQYLTQPLGESLHIAMTPIARYTGEPTAFAIVNGGAGLLLIGSDGSLDLTVPPMRRFVFVRPR